MSVQFSSVQSLSRVQSVWLDIFIFCTITITIALANSYILSHNYFVQCGDLRFNLLSSVSSVSQLCPTLCNPMNCSMPGLPVHNHLPEFTQTHVHRVSDAIQPSHPLSSPFPPVSNPSQHQSLFKWANSSHQVAKVLEFQLQHHSFQWHSGLISLGWTGWISLQFKGLESSQDSREDNLL